MNTCIYDTFGRGVCVHFCMLYAYIDWTKIWGRFACFIPDHRSHFKVKVMFRRVQITRLWAGLSRVVRWLLSSLQDRKIDQRLRKSLNSSENSMFSCHLRSEPQPLSWRATRSESVVTTSCAKRIIIRAHGRRWVIERRWCHVAPSIVSCTCSMHRTEF